MGKSSHPWNTHTQLSPTSLSATSNAAFVMHTTARAHSQLQHDHTSRLDSSSMIIINNVKLTNKPPSYVLLSAATTSLLHIWHSIWASRYRKAAGIPHPHPYAPLPLDVTSASPSSASSSSSSSSDTGSEKAKLESYYLFNCAQRAHAHYLENYAIFNVAMLISGLRYPLLSAAAGAVWSVSRVAFALGYVRRGVEKGRGRVAGLGQGYAVVQIGLMLGAAWTGLAISQGW